MNFLEQLVSEWYSYKGYYVRANVKVGRRDRGGYEGELDVLAFNPDRNEVLHVETSTDALSWDKKMERLRHTFQLGKTHIPPLFNRVRINITQRAVLAEPPSFKRQFAEDFEVVSISEFLGGMLSELQAVHPLRAAVPENYRLIRTLQFAQHYVFKNIG